MDYTDYGPVHFVLDTLWLIYRPIHIRVRCNGCARYEHEGLRRAHWS